MQIDVSNIKEIIQSLNGIKPFDKKMTFYYDESGNCRKFSLTEKGFSNIDAIKGDFVLAGVAHKGLSFNIDIPALKLALDYKEGQTEIKFRHLYHNSNDFLSFICGKKATAFLKWLSDSGLYIHYCAFNNLYYSLVDIVDSLWETHPQCIMYVDEIKSALYDFVIVHQDEVIEVLRRHTYPDVKNASAFCNELSLLIRSFNDDSEYYPGFFLELLGQMLKTAGKLEKIVFIQDNEPFLLVDEYYILYLERCEIFSNSKHIFDEEPTVQKQFSEVELYEGDVLINNWQFVESNKNIYVQISDLVAGLLRKLFMFLDEKALDEIITISLKLNDKQVENFTTLWNLISKSEKMTPLFIENVNSPKNVKERRLKLQFLGVDNKKIKDIRANLPI